MGKKREGTRRNAKELKMRGLLMCWLLAGVVLTTSCGLVRAPFRIVGGLTRATVEAGRKAKLKAQAKSERRKQEKEAKGTGQQQIEAAFQDSALNSYQKANIALKFVSMFSGNMNVNKQIAMKKDDLRHNGDRWFS